MILRASLLHLRADTNNTTTNYCDTHTTLRMCSLMCTTVTATAAVPHISFPLRTCISTCLLVLLCDVFKHCEEVTAVLCHAERAHAQIDVWMVERNRGKIN
jgi:hypothetical protein